VYIKRDFTPADKDTWELAKVIFDAGEMVLLANEPAPASPRSTSSHPFRETNQSDS
jgi:hypothetical protein